MPVSNPNNNLLVTNLLQVTNMLQVANSLEVANLLMNSSLGTIGTPTFSPVAGAYGPTQTVTITAANSTAIYYTTDGSVPTIASTLYIGPVSVASTETVKAIGTAASWVTSAVGSASYTINGAVGTPTFNPVAGTYSGTQSVAIAAANSTSIYYTTDGSAPTTGSTLYTGAISVAASKTIKALGVAAGWSNSAVGSAAYVITAVYIASSTVTLIGSSTLDTTGATLLVAVLGVYIANPTISDSKGNTWNYLTAYQRASGTYVRIAYAWQSGALGPLTTGAGHTFTAIGADGAGVVFAFSGTYTAGDPFDGQVNGAIATIAQGAITPSAGDLVISGFLNNNGSTAGSTITGAGSDIAWSAMLVQASTTYETGAAAYLLSASGAALNPTMYAGITGNNNTGAATIAGFKHA